MMYVDFLSSTLIILQIMSLMHSNTCTSCLIVVLNVDKPWKESHFYLIFNLMLWQPADLCYGTMSLSRSFTFGAFVLVFLPVAFDWVRWPTYLFSFSRFTFYFHVFMCGARKKAFLCSMLMFHAHLRTWPTEENSILIFFEWTFWEAQMIIDEVSKCFFSRNDKLPSGKWLGDFSQIEALVIRLNFRRLFYMHIIKKRVFGHFSLWNFI